jgi:lipoprotein-releasing system permease protein
LNLPFFVARRYFFSKKKTNFINVINFISMLGVCVGTAALVVVLSVFNGMEDLFRSLYSTFSSEIQVRPAKGKTFVIGSDTKQKIQQIPGVVYAGEVIEDNAVLVYNDAQMVIRLRGTTEALLKYNGLESKMVEGRLSLGTDSAAFALLGAGVQYTLSIPLNDDFHAMEIIYPKKRKRLNLSSPQSLNRFLIRPSGIFAIEQTYDNDYVFVPLSFARQLFETEDRISYLEIKTQPEAMFSVQKAMQKLLGKDLEVKNRDQQNASILRAISIEKLIVQLTLSLIVAISSFNIFFSLTILAIEKQKDVAVLFALGAQEGTVSNIFLFEGGIIAFSGAFIGFLLGIGICLLQQMTGFVSMGMETAVVNAYPVKMQVTDLVLTCLTIVFITLLSSFFPARKVAKANHLASLIK